MLLLLIDGNAIMHRAFHALPPLTTSEGVPTNAIYGFFSMLHGVISLYKPDSIAVCFDTPKPTFRAEMFKEYQVQRPSMPDEFKRQIPHIQNLLDAAKISRFQKDGFEADDIIGTLSDASEKRADKTLILTGDKDIFQLVSANTSVVSPKTGISNVIVFDESAVEQKMGVKPKQIPDYKALVGDPSDNYKGVKGVGPKTAAKLISDFGSVENMFENINLIENVRLRQLISDNKEVINFTKKLATIVRDVDISFNYDSLKFNGYDLAMKDHLTKLQFWSILKKYFPSSKQEPQKTKDQKIKKNPQQTLF